MKPNALSLVLFALLTHFALALGVEAVVPPPDGGYPGGNTAEGQNALFSLTSGTYNTAVGFFALRSDTDGDFNTAIGAGALFANTAGYNTATGSAALLNNTTGDSNTATGFVALSNNTTGYWNSAFGAYALEYNITGIKNTATGYGALPYTMASENTADGYAGLYSDTTGCCNTAMGSTALFYNTTGAENIAVGARALHENIGGSGNTAVGLLALGSNVSGLGNIALGYRSGISIVTANDVICIGSLDGENVSHTCFIDNIRGVTTINNDAMPVYIDSAGQLGTASSSRRFKRDINPIGNASEAVLALKPVSFAYKTHKNNTLQFGLLAEDVAEANPDLVIYDTDGKPFAVRYEAVNAMLLNEFLKEHHKVQKQEATIAQLKQDFQSRLADQQKQIEALTVGLQKVSEQMNRPAPQVVNPKA